MPRPLPRTSPVLLTRVRAASFLIVGLMSPCAHGDIVVAEYVGPTDFHVEISEMPDLDQIRSSLPSWGYHHGVPTALMNLVTYAANNGFPELDPGSADYQLQSTYLQATDAIHAFGLVAQTNDDGTYLPIAASALQAWLDEYSGRLVVETQKAGTTYGPTAPTIAAKIASGAIVAMVYGIYPIIGSPFADPLTVGQRVGGVCAIPGLVKRDNGGPATLAIRLPFTTSPTPGGESPGEQSPFEWAYTAPVKERVVLDLSNFTTFPRSVVGVAPVLDGEAGPFALIIDALIAIRPRGSYSWKNNVAFPAITIHSSGAFDRIFETDDVHTPALPPGQVLQSMAPLFSHTLVGVTASDTGQCKLFKLDLSDDSATLVDDLPQNSKVATSPDGDVYVLGSGKLRRYDLSLDPPLVEERNDAGFYMGIAYDDANDRVVLYAPGLRLLTRFKPDLSDDTFFIMPNTVPTATGGDVTVGPTGAMWVHPSGMNALYEAMPVRGSQTPTIESLSNSAINGFTDFSVDDMNRLFVCVNGALREYWFDPKEDRWEDAPDSPSGLDGTPCDGKLVLARRRIDFDSSMISPAWRSLDGDEIPSFPTTPDCLGDLSPDHVVNGADLAVLLGAWGAGAGTPADINKDGMVDGADLATLLGAWGECP